MKRYRLARGPSFFILLAVLANGGIYAEDSLVLDSDISATVLSKSTTLVINPPEISEADYQIAWNGKPMDGVEAALVPESIQWVRTQDVLVLARARLHVKVRGTATGIVRNAGASQMLDQQKDSAHAEIPVALISGAATEITLQRPGETTETKGSFSLKFHSTKSAEDRVHIDASCSPYQMRADSIALTSNSWAFVGCRLVYTEGADHLIPSLEMFVYWEGVGQTLLMNGVSAPSTLPSLWQMRLRSEPGFAKLESSASSEKQTLLLSYRLRPELHLGSFGFGIGPYNYRYSTATGKENVQSAAAVLTLYGSVFFNHYMRTVLFSILPIHSKIFNDTGIYLMIEQARILDNRMSINFLLGGHGILFPYDGANYFRFSFPQGIEVVFRDLPFRRNNLMFGAFAYPFAGERSYYNIWLRWGMGPYFGEVNYIKWDEIVRSGTLVGAEMWGLSFGMPLMEFL
jgi:hypothetical protein